MLWAESRFSLQTLIAVNEIRGSNAAMNGNQASHRM